MSLLSVTAFFPFYGNTTSHSMEIQAKGKKKKHKTLADYTSEAISLVLILAQKITW